MATTYSEKLRDPRWQKKRLEVFANNEFSCEQCGNSKETLHAHHKEYFRGREPWEYEASQLACLCESCHKSTHDEEDSLKLICSLLNMDGPRSRSDVASLVAGFIGLDLDATKQTNQDEKIITSPTTYLVGRLASVVYSSDFYGNTDAYLLSDMVNAVLSHPKEFTQMLIKFTIEADLNEPKGSLAS